MSEALRKAAEQAIDTLGYYASVCGEDDQDTPAKQAQAALRAALAEPEQSEPDDMPSGSNCKWPTCQTEQYQQMLCKEIAQSLGLDEQSEPVACKHGVDDGACKECYVGGKTLSI